MFIEITKIEYPKITVLKDGKSNVYEVEDQVKESFIALGPAEVNFNDITKKVSFLRMEQKEDQKTGKGSSDDDIVNFEKLLSAAHKLKAKFSIKTQKLEVDTVKKYALFKAIVFVEDKKAEGGNLYYEAHGDATEDNCGDLVKKHYIRMAETRAICRALRWYTNNGCAEEEK